MGHTVIIEEDLDNSNIWEHLHTSQIIWNLVVLGKITPLLKIFQK
jgi:hypothetical protein